MIEGCLRALVMTTSEPESDNQDGNTNNDDSVTVPGRP
jgi:hypothetical protein